MTAARRARAEPQLSAWRHAAVRRRACAARPASSPRGDPASSRSPPARDLDGHTVRAGKGHVRVARSSAARGARAAESAPAVGQLRSPRRARPTTPTRMTARSRARHQTATRMSRALRDVELRARAEVTSAQWKGRRGGAATFAEPLGRRARRGARSTLAGAAQPASTACATETADDRGNKAAEAFRDFIVAGDKAPRAAGSCSPPSTATSCTSAIKVALLFVASGPQVAAARARDVSRGRVSSSGKACSAAHARRRRAARMKEADRGGLAFAVITAVRDHQRACEPDSRAVRSSLGTTSQSAQALVLHLPRQAPSRRARETFSSVTVESDGKNPARLSRPARRSCSRTCTIARSICSRRTRRRSRCRCSRGARQGRPMRYARRFGSSRARRSFIDELPWRSTIAKRDRAAGARAIEVRRQPRSASAAWACGNGYGGGGGRAGMRG